MAVRQARTERVQMRIEPAAKRMLERAATLSNMTVSTFVASNALEAADRLIRERERLVLAAMLSNMTVSTFAASNALEAADRLIHERERERLVLSGRDWNLFFDALVSPPEPNAALRGAFAAHRHLIAKTPGA